MNDQSLDIPNIVANDSESPGRALNVTSYAAPGIAGPGARPPAGSAHTPTDWISASDGPWRPPRGGAGLPSQAVRERPLQRSGSPSVYSGWPRRCTTNTPGDSGVWNPLSAASDGPS